VSRAATVVLTLGVALLALASPAAAVDSFFDVFTEIPVVGVAPLPPLVEYIGHMNAGTFIHELNHNISLKHGGASGGGPLPFEVALSDGQPVGTPANASFFDITYRPDLAGGQPFPTDSFFDVFHEIDIPGGGPSHLVPLHPGVPDSFFDVFATDSFFDVFFQVEVGPGGGCDVMHMHFAFADGFMPANAHVVPSPNFDSFFDVFFDVFFNPQPEPPALPMIHVTTTGDYLSAPLTVQPATWGEVKSLYRQ
jgi:hypothetical protein